METDRKDQKWIIVRIDGKIAAISTDYRQLAAISSQLAIGLTPDAAKTGKERRKKKTAAGCQLYENISATAVGFDEIWKLRQELQWEDLFLFGTDFPVISNGMYVAAVLFEHLTPTQRRMVFRENFLRLSGYTL